MKMCLVYVRVFVHQHLERETFKRKAQMSRVVLQNNRFDSPSKVTVEAFTQI